MIKFVAKSVSALFAIVATIVVGSFMYVTRDEEPSIIKSDNITNQNTNTYLT